MNSITQYGPGDPETWGPVTSRADPRYDDTPAGRRDLWINERADVLMRAECDPFDPVGMLEALGAMPTTHPQLVAALAARSVIDDKPRVQRCEFDAADAEIGALVVQWSCDYWRKLAERRAAEEYDEQDGGYEEC